ncbi:MAG: hypothetical protein ACJA07_000500 [Rhodococcus sp. (in: high G+C Gram-positive bacteria)]|jgi:hypothetical protein
MRRVVGVPSAVIDAATRSNGMPAGRQSADAPMVALYCAHAVRIRALDTGALPLSVVREFASGEFYNAISDPADSDRRFATGRALLRIADNCVDPTVGLCGRWLLSDKESSLVAAERLACALHMVERNWVPYVALGWWSVHGRAVLDVLLGDEGPPQAGRPTPSQQQRIDQLALACRSLLSTQSWSKSSLANHVGISRPTLDAWLNRGIGTPHSAR